MLYEPSVLRNQFHIDFFLPASIPGKHVLVLIYVQSVNIYTFQTCGDLWPDVGWPLLMDLASIFRACCYSSAPFFKCFYSSCFLFISVLIIIKKYTNKPKEGAVDRHLRIKASVYLQWFTASTQMQRNQLPGFDVTSVACAHIINEVFGVLYLILIFIFTSL